MRTYNNELFKLICLFKKAIIKAAEATEQENSIKYLFWMNDAIKHITDIRNILDYVHEDENNGVKHNIDNEVRKEAESIAAIVD